jgi:hypothetical protein
MAKNDFPKPTKADSWGCVGHAKDNKDASVYTGFKYPSGGGNDIGIYKQPMPNPNGTEQEAVAKSGNRLDKANISVAGISKGNYAAENKNGEKTMRGYGAATKGIKTRGPMA